MRTIELLNKHLRKLVEMRIIGIYNKKINYIFKLRPDLKAPIPDDIRRKHINLYKSLSLPCNDKYIRFYSNVSGIIDYRYVPESLFSSRIERVLNDCETGNHEYEDKNLIDKLVNKKYLPKTLIRYIRGCFYDEDYNYLSSKQVNELLSNNKGNLIGKIASESSGGKGITEFIFKNGSYQSNSCEALTADWIEKNFSYYCIQNKIIQCDFSAQFNNSSVNTCRIITFRCPWDGKVVVLKSFLRLGASNSIVDNLSSGGVAVALNKEGYLDACAFTYKDYRKVKEHPVSKVRFQGLKHPYFKQMSEVVIEIASNIPNHNIISWDVVADCDGQVKIIEMNLTAQSSDVPQLSFGPLFGEYTEKVIDWVVKHENNSNFKHFRTF